MSAGIGGSHVALLGLFCGAMLEGCGERAAVATDPAQLARGSEIYARSCAACHGANLEGQPNWRQRLPNDRLPAPPHDDTGHTWHHTDDVLFAIVKHGPVPPNAPLGYQSDMPAFEGTLSDDDIRAALAYIASRWSSEVQGVRAQMLEQAKR